MNCKMCGKEISRSKKFCSDCAYIRLRQKQTEYRRKKGINPKSCIECGIQIPRGHYHCKNCSKKKEPSRTIKVPSNMQWWNRGAFFYAILESNRFKPKPNYSVYRWVQKRSECL